MGCAEKNPLIREGTSSATRELAALSPSFAKPDERQAADLLLFLRRYSAYLNYYNENNALDGDWQPFLKADVSVTLASLAALNLQKSSDYKKALFKKIKRGNDAVATKSFKQLFDFLFSIPLIITEQYHSLAADFEYGKEVQSIIQAKLLLPVVNLKNLYDLFNADGLIDTTATLDSDAPLPLFSSTSFAINQLGSEWILPSPVSALYVPALPSVQQKIVYLINHNFFTSQIELLLKAASVITAKAAALFQTTVDNFPSHPAHTALLLSFIKLFRTAQDELNAFSQRHLDFYYKDVLQLHNKSAEPDTIHLLFALQKPVDKHLLQKGILLKGGKDSATGKERHYTLTEDVVVNRASVESLKAIQVMKGVKDFVAAYPIAASEDGEGGKLVSPDNSWFTFGNPSFSPETFVGFGIASNILFLAEGRRRISITVNFIPGTTSFAESFPIIHGDFFTAKLTTSKGWHNAAIQVTASAVGDSLTFSLTLEPNDPSIVPYNEKTHKEEMELGLPVLKIYLNQNLPSSYPYRLLTKDRVISVSITVDVNGVKELMLSNDTGSIDAAKPFKPFGEFPDTDASFYIGSKEIFQKNLTELSFVFGDDISPKANVNYLHDGAWNISEPFAANTKTLLLAGQKFPSAAIDFSKNEALTPTTLEGFVRLRLGTNIYSMDQYLQEVKDQINNTRVTKTANDPVTYEISTGDIAAPPSLVLSSFSINYKASATISFINNSSDQHTSFLHLTSFGYKTVAFDPDRPSKKVTLAPELPNDGELFIGLNNTSVEEVVNILFQVAEGSSNPLKDVENIEWSYLNKNNEWATFESRFVIDRTAHLTEPGIVTLTLPQNITNQATLLPKGLYWVKAAVKQNPDAVCKLILVQAGAAAATLLQEDGIAFTQTLLANTVSKLLVADASIKTISQPFDSFGGRTKESDTHFYVRVSERLRHKQRAITVWDYEHIILEQFPQISKVRCINDAGFYKGPSNTDVFCENYPGHVTIITIPDFRNRSGIDSLKPYTPIGVLNKIYDYLKTITSPFVKLHVKNPQFEEVQLEFDVSFYPQLDEGFYRQLLATEIEKFLTPWAYGGGEISFGSKVIKSVLLNFIEERPYVDFVINFQMHHIIRRNGATHLEEKRNVEEAVPSTARSLLVSYKNEVTKQTHIIHSPATC